MLQYQPHGLFWNDLLFRDKVPYATNLFYYEAGTYCTHWEVQKHLQILLLQPEIDDCIGHWISAYYDGSIIRIYDSMNIIILHKDAVEFVSRLLPYTPAIQICKVQAQQNYVDWVILAIVFCVSVFLLEKSREQVSAFPTIMST